MKLGGIRNQRFQGKCRAYAFVSWGAFRSLDKLTKGQSSVKALREGPLRLVQLLSAARNVIGSSVSEDIVQSFSFSNILGGFANDNCQLGLVVARLVNLAQLGDNSLSRPGVHKRCARLPILVSVCVSRGTESDCT